MVERCPKQLDSGPPCNILMCMATFLVGLYLPQLTTGERFLRRTFKRTDLQVRYHLRFVIIRAIQVWLAARSKLTVLKFNVTVARIVSSKNLKFTRHDVGKWLGNRAYQTIACTLLRKIDLQEKIVTIKAKLLCFDLTNC